MGTDRMFTAPINKAIKYHSRHGPTYASLFSFLGKYNVGGSVGLPKSEWGKFMPSQRNKRTNNILNSMQFILFQGWLILKICTIYSIHRYTLRVSSRMIKKQSSAKSWLIY